MDTQMEKRRFTRANTRIPVRYRTLGEPAGKPGIGTLSADLGGGGVHFRAAGFISKSARLMLEIDIPGETPVKAIARVAWIRKAPFGDNYEIGNQFLEISKKDRELITDYVSSIALYNDLADIGVTDIDTDK